MLISLSHVPTTFMKVTLPHLGKPVSVQRALKNRKEVAAHSNMQ